MSSPIDALIADLGAEHSHLHEMISGRQDEELVNATLAEGWSVVDQLSHLAGFDESAALALVDPEGFTTELARLIEAGEDPIVGYTDRGRSMSPTQVVSWWNGASAALLTACQVADPAVRVPWYGPAMSPMSFITARLMETWAHGVDIADAWSEPITGTARLRHVCHIGVGARRYSYAVRGLDLPDVDVRVELIGPAGDVWTWGSSATEVVRGEALDFALLVVQRRHRNDTSLVIAGDAALEWMSFAQAFAGGPGAGRPHSSDHS